MRSPSLEPLAGCSILETFPPRYGSGIIDRHDRTMKRLAGCPYLARWQAFQVRSCSQWCPLAIQFLFFAKNGEVPASVNIHHIETLATADGIKEGHEQRNAAYVSRRGAGAEAKPRGTIRFVLRRHTFIDPVPFEIEALIQYLPRFSRTDPVPARWAVSVERPTCSRSTGDTTGTDHCVPAWAGCRSRPSGNPDLMTGTSESRFRGA